MYTPNFVNIKYHKKNESLKKNSTKKTDETFCEVYVLRLTIHIQTGTA